MCGIVGLHLKKQTLYPHLGAWITPMLLAMSERGPDSAGIALYEDGLADGAFRYSLRAPGPDYDWDRFLSRLNGTLGPNPTLRRIADDAILTARLEPDHAFPALKHTAPELHIFACGQALEIYKDVGAPADICRRYGIADRSGYQALGHTRMATESAVTSDHSHPFAASPDFCLVHNGTFSNYATVRRNLTDAGIRFDTDNDSEVAARFIAFHMAHGLTLRQALAKVFTALDGFFTLLVATRNEFAVVRDAFACKPAVIAECEDYVAMASEYRALAQLPGIKEATVFEPMPEEIHIWSR